MKKLMIVLFAAMFGAASVSVIAQDKKKDEKSAKKGDKKDDKKGDKKDGKK